MKKEILTHLIGFFIPTLHVLDRVQLSMEKAKYDRFS